MARSFFFSSLSFSLQSQRAVARKLQRRRGFECTLFAATVKNLRSKEEAWFCKIKAFYSNRMYSYGKKREKCEKVGRDENSSYSEYFSSRHYGHNHLSVARESSLSSLMKLPEEELGREKTRQKVIISRRVCPSSVGLSASEEFSI